jgi:FkbM family methyltransferase
VLPEHDHITDAIRRTGTYYERDLLDAIRERRPRGVLVDVGAHFGNHTTIFGAECGAERVVAIEPNPSAHAGLLVTIAENGLGGGVVPRQVAAHPSWRSVRTTTLPWRPRQGTSARTNSGRVGISPADAEADAPAAPLDEIVGEFDRVAVLKVDAERMSIDILLSVAPHAAARPTARCSRSRVRLRTARVAGDPFASRIHRGRPLLLDADMALASTHSESVVSAEARLLLRLEIHLRESCRRTRDLIGSLTRCSLSRATRLSTSSSGCFSTSC